MFSARRNLWRILVISSFYGLRRLDFLRWNNFLSLPWRCYLTCCNKADNWIEERKEVQESQQRILRDLRNSQYWTEIGNWFQWILTSLQCKLSHLLNDIKRGSGKAVLVILVLPSLSTAVSSRKYKLWCPAEFPPLLSYQRPRLSGPLPQTMGEKAVFADVCLTPHLF